MIQEICDLWDIWWRFVTFEKLISILAIENDNLFYLTSESDTEQHLHFLQCLGHPQAKCCRNISRWNTWVVQYAGGRERVRGLPHYAAAETVSPPPPPRLSCSIIHVLSTGSTTCNHYPYRECTRACINNILFACKWNRLPTGELFPQFWKKSFGLVSEVGGSEKQGLTGYRYPKKWPGST